MEVIADVLPVAAGLELRVLYEVSGGVDRREVDVAGPGPFHELTLGLEKKEGS
jgi:hypothetical protein